MLQIHVKNLEKYHPGYKDRTLIWCKTYFKMMNHEPEFEMLCEIDKWRFIAIIMLELQTQKPVPINELWLARKGFDFKKRPISHTLQMLHNLIELSEIRYTDVTQSRVDKSIVDKNRLDKIRDIFSYFCLKTKKTPKYELNYERKKWIDNALNRYTVEELKRAVDNFILDDWPGRKEHMDLIYCLGKQQGKPDNIEKWLNKTPTDPYKEKRMI